MKKFGTTLSFVLLLLLTSCEEIQEALNFGMDADIDGTSWVSVTRVTVLSDNKFTITGTSAGGEILVITINGSNTGTYTLNPIILKTECGCTYKQSLNSNSADWFLSAEGTVNLSEVDKTDKKISGTFSFTLTNGNSIKTVSNGEFRNLSYQ